MSRYQYIWRLKVVYPEGSHEKGWRPALWSDPEFLKKLSRDERRALRKREFRWPGERMFLSSSGAWGRAGLLLAYGAQVDVQRSERIQWPAEPAAPVPYQGWREEPDIPRFGAEEVFLCGCRRAVTGAGRRTLARGLGAGVSSVRSGSGRPLRLPGCEPSSPRACLSQW